MVTDETTCTCNKNAFHYSSFLPCIALELLFPCADQTFLRNRSEFRVSSSKPVPILILRIGRYLRTRPLRQHGDVCVYHEPDQFLEARFRLPAEFFPRLG